MPDSPSTAPSRAADPGLYTRAAMRLRYTPQVIWWRHRWVWGVPNALLHARYAALTGPHHVCVGPGNGYFLARLPRWNRLRRLELLDVNPACLRASARALRGRYRLDAHLHNALEPWEGIADAGADSVDCHMTLHAIRRGTMAELAPLVCEAHRVLAPGGRFFGATILPPGPEVRAGRAAHRLIEAYNRAGVFFNAADTLEGLRALLAGPFDPQRVRLEVHGCVAVWAVTK